MKVQPPPMAFGFPLFSTFRIVYIPVSILAHSGHGLVWLTITAALVATFAAEALTRRSFRPDTPTTPRRDGALVVLALLLLGFFPEEAPIGVILWAAIGAAWARLGAGIPAPIGLARIPPVIVGALLGLTGLWGPGSWLMAGLLALWLWWLPISDD